MCEPEFTVPISVPLNMGGGSGVGDPHFETVSEKLTTIRGVAMRVQPCTHSFA